MDKSIGDMRTMGGAPEPGGYTLSEGDTLGQYRVMRALGRGGMGEVYEVEHETLELRYALKLLPADFATHADALGRFRREARVTACLEHPHIVKVDEFGETDGRYWLRMECANGVEYGDICARSLQDLTDASGGRIGQETLAGILRQVLKALGHAHRQGVVHRDLKPSNILIFTDARGSSFKIADFGLVRLVGEDWVRNKAQLTIQRSMSMGEQRTMAGPDSSEGSSTRSLLGTFEYMSPEQKRGEDATAASDVYAVGLMAYRLLTGRSLGLKTPSEIDSRLAGGWDLFVGKALEEDPEERPGSAEEALTLLEAVTEQIQRAGEEIGEQGSAIERQGRVSAPRRTAEARRRREGSSTRAVRGTAVKKSDPSRRVYAGAGIFLLLAVFGAALWGMSIRQGTRTPSPPAPMLAARDTGDEEAGRTRQVEERRPEEEILRREEEARRLEDETRSWAEEVRLREEEVRRREEEARRLHPRVPVGFSVEGQDLDRASGLPMTIVHDQAGYRLRLVPAGEFMLGSLDGEGGADERPRRRIYLDAYWIGEAPVTCTQYAVFLNEEGNQSEGGAPWVYFGPAIKIGREGDRFEARPGMGEHPVVEVSWFGARAFARWLGGDLPTESQWEKAAKGGRDARWPWGNSWDGSKANTAERLAGVPELKSDDEWQAWWESYQRETLAQKRDYSDTTVPVRRYAPNGYGLYGMAGNVWEWCMDWYVADAYARLRDGQRNPTPPGSGDMMTIEAWEGSEFRTMQEACRVMRGGGWYDRSLMSRCTYRTWVTPTIGGVDCGVRVVVAPRP